MPESTHALLLNALTEFDRKQSGKRGYNPYALGHYAAALQRAERYVSAGFDLRAAIITCFLGRLCDVLLRSVKLPVMTDSEAKRGLAHPLPEMDDD